MPNIKKQYQHIRILMYVLDDMRYDARVIREAAALSEMGLKVRVLCLHEKGISRFEIHKYGFEIQRIKLFFKKFKKNKIILFLKWMEFFIKAFIKSIQYKPDIIHCHDLYPLPLAYLVNLLLKKKLIYDSHELWMGLTPKRPSKYELIFEKFLIDHSNTIITTNEYRARFLKLVYKIPKDKISIIHNYPMKDNTNKNIAKTNNIINQFKNKGKKIIIYQGCIAEERGIEIIINSLIHVSNKWVAVIIGYTYEQDYLKNLKNLVKNNKVEKKVIFLPPVKPNQMPDYIRQSDAGFVYYKPDSLNSKYCASNKIWDYITEGVPIIGNNIPGLKEIEELGLGITINNNTFTDKELMKLHSIKIDKNIMMKYTWTQEKIVLQTIYENIIK